jgi:hypothetical protein
MEMFKGKYPLKPIPEAKAGAKTARKKKEWLWEKSKVIFCY